MQAGNLRHRVISAAPPGMAPEYTFEGQPEAFQRPVFAECLQSVLGARRSKPAGRSRLERGYAQLIELYQQYERYGKYVPDTAHFIDDRIPAISSRMTSNFTISAEA